ncbi:putative YccA/Bax inhibitor family protein [Nakamurella flavida]|nr:Bax inhibitor-1/YccA family protein [Nakamurella flavida]MDP9779821.1 putative YccA/Bax inhibitor family protein [Nakamurella flavida]
MQTSNPAFKKMGATADAQRQAAPSAEYLNQMYAKPSAGVPARERFLTIDDVVMKTATILGIAVIAGALTAWSGLTALALPAVLVGFVLALVIIFKQSSNPFLISAYAAAQGVFLGTITSLFNSIYPGIGLQAIVGTVGVFAAMLVVYKTGAIRVTPKLTKVIIGSMMGILVLVVFNLIMGLFGVETGLRSGGTMAIIFSLVIIVVAALSFLLDFDAIDKGIKAGLPAKTSWYFAFGLMVTLVWLYIEILRLLSYFRD